MSEPIKKLANTLGNLADLPEKDFEQFTEKLSSKLKEISIDCMTLEKSLDECETMEDIKNWRKLNNF